jgi:hypothetical protein
VVEIKVREHETNLWSKESEGARDQFDKFAGFKFVVEIKEIEHEKNPAKEPVDKIRVQQPPSLSHLSLSGVCVCVCVLHNIKLDSESTTVKRLKKRLGVHRCRGSDQRKNAIALFSPLTRNLRRFLVLDSMVKIVQWNFALISSGCV